MRWQARVVALLLFWVAASGIDASAQTWRKHVYKSEGFETEFSGDIMVRPSVISEEAKARIVRSTKYIQEGANFKYTVVATLTKSGVNFDKGVEAGFGSFKCQTVVGQTPLSVPKGQGREMRGAGCADALQVEARYYETGNWFYQVLAEYKVAGGEQAARRFVESFKIIAK
jgi:hypothetical protein